jgi:protein-S-isoprenylcysteine O-methyltransferase Ste14
MKNDTAHAHVLVPPPLVFLGYLIGALLLNWALPFRTPWTPILQVVGGLAVLVGLLLAGSAFSRMRKVHTSPDAQQPTTALVTDGPYAFTRNPIYLGFFLIYLGFTLLAGTVWGILLSPFLLPTVTRAIVEAEEAYLETKFEHQYTEYKARVHQWL